MNRFFGFAPTNFAELCSLFGFKFFIESLVFHKPSQHDDFFRINLGAKLEQFLKKLLPQYTFSVQLD